MTDNLLYFPYINMPKSTWTTISVLYWNEVHAIVPDLYKDRPNRLEDNMRQLVEAGLVNQVFPYQYVRHLPNFDRAFLALIDAPDFNLQAKQQAFKQRQVSRIHIQKLSEDLLRELEERRIVQREDWEWYHMERHTARLFMTYLATVISKAEGFTPATDSSRNIDFSLNENRFSGYRLASRNRFLNDLMPYPITAHPYRLRDFKDIYSDQLGTFRNRLEQIIIEITNIRDRESREIYYQLKLREIMERRDEIYARLNEFDFGKVVFGTVFGLVAAGLAFDTGHPLVGSFAFVNAVYSALEGYDRSDITRGDFAYLALIDTKFGMSGRRLQ